MSPEERLIEQVREAFRMVNAAYEAAADLGYELEFIEVDLSVISSPIKRTLLNPQLKKIIIL